MAKRRLAVALEARRAALDQRVGRHLEGEPIDHHQPQGVTGYVDPFPEARRREQDRVPEGAKTLDEYRLRGLSLDQQRRVEGRALGEGVHHADGCAEDKRAAAGQRHERLDLLRRLVEEPPVPRVGQVGRAVERGLLEVVEGRWESELVELEVDPQP